MVLPGPSGYKKIFKTLDCRVLEDSKRERKEERTSIPKIKSQMKMMNREAVANQYTINKLLLKKVTFLYQNKSQIKTIKFQYFKPFLFKNNKHNEPLSFLFLLKGEDKDFTKPKRYTSQSTTIGKSTLLSLFFCWSTFPKAKKLCPINTHKISKGIKDKSKNKTRTYLYLTFSTGLTKTKPKTENPTKTKIFKLVICF